MFNFLKKPNQQKDELWQEFRGVKNTDYVLEHKALKLAPLITYLSAESTGRLFESLKNENNDKYAEVFLETSIFYLHFIDRMAFQYLGQKQRDVFMNKLSFETCKKASEAYGNNPETEATFYGLFGRIYDQRQSEYGKCKKILPDKNEGMANTLFWEFGKKIAGMIKPQIDVVLIMSIQEYVATPVTTVLRIPQLLKE